MTLKETLMNDMKTAMKSGDAVTLGVLRMIISAVRNKEIEKKTESLSDADTLAVLTTDAKKRKDSIDAFTKAGRKDLANKEKEELETMQKYLPAQMSAADVDKKVAAIVKKLGSKEMGPAMKAVMAELRGKADSGMINEAVKKAIGGK
jgi:uncharacterized protein